MEYYIKLMKILLSGVKVSIEIFATTIVFDMLYVGSGKPKFWHGLDVNNHSFVLHSPHLVLSFPCFVSNNKPHL